MKEKVYTFPKPAAFSAYKFSSMPAPLYCTKGVNAKPVWLSQVKKHKGLEEATPDLLSKMKIENYKCQEHGIYCNSCGNLFMERDFIKDSDVKNEAIALYHDEWYKAYIRETENIYANNPLNKMICPHCGQELNLSENVNSWIEKAKITEIGDKIALTIILKHAFVNSVSKNVIYKNTVYRYVFNCKTGQSYYLPAIHNGKKSTQENAHIQCVTFSWFPVNVDIPKKVITSLAAAIFKKQGCPEKKKEYTATLTYSHD